MKKTTKLILLAIVIGSSIFYFMNERITNIKEGVENECSGNQKNIASKNNARLKSLLTSYDTMEANIKKSNNDISINKSNITNNEKSLKKLGEKAEEQEKKNKYGKS
jgi:uncharacterized protein HemX